MMDQRNILRARWISSCRRGELFVAGDNREGGAFFRFSVGTRGGTIPLCRVIGAGGAQGVSV